MSSHSLITTAKQQLKHLIEYPELILTIGRRVDRQVVRDLLFVKKTLQINPLTILDVGASVGNWSNAANYVFPSASLLAFEPLPDVYASLGHRFRNSHTIKTLNLALGRTNDRCAFYRNRFSFSSSFLRMTGELKRLFPHAAEATEILVERRRLDTVPDVVLIPPVFLKVDSQGAELDVLEGCGELLSGIACVQLEVNFAPLYEGQPTPQKIVEYMCAKGFDRFLQWHPHFQDGQVICCDMLFFRNGDVLR